MSGEMTGKAIDLTPPEPPVWNTPPAIPMTLSDSEATVVLDWLPVSDPSGVEYALQRKLAGSPLWLGVSGWLDDQPAPQYVDADVAPGADYFYRVRAIDGSGNRGDWSTEISVSVAMAP